MRCLTKEAPYTLSLPHGFLFRENESWCEHAWALYTLPLPQSFLFLAYISRGIKLQIQELMMFAVQQAVLAGAKDQPQPKEPEAVTGHTLLIYDNLFCTLASRCLRILHHEGNPLNMLSWCTSVWYVS